MDWLMEPFTGFKEIIQNAADGCSEVWSQCTCTAGLKVCIGSGSLNSEEPPG